MSRPVAKPKKPVKVSPVTVTTKTGGLSMTFSVNVAALAEHIAKMPPKKGDPT